MGLVKHGRNTSTHKHLCTTSCTTLYTNFFKCMGEADTLSPTKRSSIINNLQYTMRAVQINKQGDDKSESERPADRERVLCVCWGDHETIRDRRWVRMDKFWLDHLVKVH